MKSISVLVALLAVFLYWVQTHLTEVEVTINDLPKDVQEWKSKGYFKTVHGRQMFVIEAGKLNASEAVVFIHGFPCSSHDYHRSLDYLIKFFPNHQLIFFDHIGFGFSDKPKEDYEYTLHDHAENALELIKLLNVKSAHFVSHDMGDSVLTEMLTRRQLGLLPAFFDDVFKSVTFTNGGMRYELIDFRIGQKLLITPIIGEFLSSISAKLPFEWGKKFKNGQMNSIYSPNADKDLMMEDNIHRYALIRYNGGSSLMFKLGSYLKDRSRFESRWFRSLKHLDIPCMLFWADSDAVSPMEIPKYLAENVIPAEHFTGKVLKDVGHFLMLEKPKEWSEIVSGFINKS